MTPAESNITGGCLCGAIRYECTHPVRSILVCHCRDCRKSSAAGAGYNVRVPADSVRISGTPSRFTITADSGDTIDRLFCATCGSQLFHQREKLRDFITLKAGCIDNSDALTISRNIWMKSAVPWLKVDPEVPGFDQEPADLRNSDYQPEV